jgi:hypothetical protein
LAQCAQAGRKNTALLNQVREILAEFGIVIGRSSDRLLTALPELTQDARLPDAMRLLEAREQFAAAPSGAL